MKNKMIIESSTPPSNTNTLWLDISDKNKSLKVFNNGKWEEINNTTSRLSDVVNTSEKAINQALMDSLSYGIRWKSGDVTSVVRVGNDTIRRDNPIKAQEIITMLDPSSLFFGDYTFPYNRSSQLTLDDQGLILYTTNYILEDDAVQDNFFGGFGRIQLLTKEGKLYVKDYYENPTSGLKIVDPITEGTKEQNSVSEIYLLEYTKYLLGKVIIDTDGRPMAEAQLDDESPALPDGVYSCSVGEYIVRPTSLEYYYYKHYILCPSFYIKSFEDNGYKEIRVSRYKIDDTWTEQKECIITPTIFPYDNKSGGVELSADIRNTDEITYQPIQEQYPVSHFLNTESMNYCEFSRIFLSLQFINAGIISRDNINIIYYPFTLGNQVVLKGIYVSSYDVKVVERDGTSKFIPIHQGGYAQYDGSKSNYFSDYFLIDNGVLIPMSDGGNKNNYIGIIENDGKAIIQQDETDETTTFTILRNEDRELKFLFSNLTYPIQYTADSNILQNNLGTGLINIAYKE